MPPPNDPMTPQRLLETADHYYRFCGCKDSHDCDVRIAELRAHADQLERDAAREKVCAEIIAIMATYREQELSGNIGTPGGLEHMGDVWRLLSRWERMLRKLEEGGS